MIGGHGNRTHIDSATLDYFRDTHKCKSMIDLGCGPGAQAVLAANRGYWNVLGVDGDGSIERPTHSEVEWMIHDFREGPLTLFNDYDLCWSNEFLEHVAPEYIPNYFPVIQKCKWFVGTYHPTPEGQQPHEQHYNENTLEYWIDVFKQYGFVYEPDITQTVKGTTNMRKYFMRKYGMVFRNVNQN